MQLITALFIAISVGFINGFRTRIHYFKDNTNNHLNQCMAEFQNEMLIAHNFYRAHHGAKPLVLNQHLIKKAQEYANQLAQTNVFQHGDDEGIGQNLSYWWNSEVNELSNCAQFVEKSIPKWYEEIDLYNFDQPGFSDATGHFTQIVWTETTDLGCGLAMARDTAVYVVCDYTPEGNVDGVFAKAVKNYIDF